MKCLLIFAGVIVTLFSGTTCLECNYCHGRNCANAGPSDIEVERCYSWRGTNYEGDIESIPTEDGDDVTKSEKAAVDTSSPSSTTAANAANETTSETAANNTTTSTTTTKRPCHTHTHPRPSWCSGWRHGYQPVCINATRRDFFGIRGKDYRGCFYTRGNVDPCLNLMRYRLVRTCNTCTTDRCN